MTPFVPERAVEQNCCTTFETELASLMYIVAHGQAAGVVKHGRPGQLGNTQAKAAVFAE